MVLGSAYTSTTAASTSSFSTTNTYSTLCTNTVITGNLYIAGNTIIRVAPGVTIWLTDEGTGGTSIYRSRQAAPVPEPTPEEARSAREAWEARVRQRAAEEAVARQRIAEERERELERVRVRAFAQERAQALLLEHLTHEQIRTMKLNGWFVVKGGKTKRDYKIHAHNYAGNIRELDDKGKEIAHLCCHCASDIPLGDQHLAQKLMLEYSEDDFLRVANRTAHYG